MSSSNLLEYLFYKTMLKYMLARIFNTCCGACFNSLVEIPLGPADFPFFSFLIAAVVSLFPLTVFLLLHINFWFQLVDLHDVLPFFNLLCFLISDLKRTNLFCFHSTFVFPYLVAFLFSNTFVQFSAHSVLC